MTKRKSNKQIELDGPERYFAQLAVKHFRKELENSDEFKPNSLMTKEFALQIMDSIDQKLQ